MKEGLLTIVTVLGSLAVVLAFVALGEYLKLPNSAKPGSLLWKCFCRLTGIYFTHFATITNVHLLAIYIAELVLIGMGVTPGPPPTHFVRKISHRSQIGDIAKNVVRTLPGKNEGAKSSYLFVLKQEFPR